MSRIPGQISCSFHLELAEDPCIHGLFLSLRPTYVESLFPKAVERAAAWPPPASIAPMLPLTNRYQYEKRGSFSAYNPFREVVGFSPNGMSFDTSPRFCSVARYLLMDSAGTPAFSAISLGRFAPHPMASRMELYMAGSRSSCRSSISAPITVLISTILVSTAIINALLFNTQFAIPHYMAMYL